MKTTIFLWILLLLFGSPLQAAELRVGAFALDITPPAGVPMAGYYHVRLNEGTHDPLFAKALVFELDGTRAALISCDLISMPREVAVRARQLIEQKTAIPGDAVMISSTHSHTGPVMTRSGLDRAAGEAARLAGQWLDSLPGRLAEAVHQANSRLTPASVSAAVGHEDSLAFNRRFHMKDGSVGWNPGKLNPAIVRPAGPVDAEVAVIYAESKQARPLATFVNYPMHLDTVGGLQYSADFPATLYEQLAAVRGSDMVTLFTMGTSGNINHINVRSETPQKGPEEAARIGTILSAEVLKTYERLQAVESSRVGYRKEVLQLDPAPVDAGEEEKARRIASKFGAPGAAPFLEMVQAFKVLDVLEKKGRPMEAEVQVITLGREVAWVGLPGEIFVELGMAIKKASPFRVTVVSTLANGSIGYVPDRKAYAEGNYEPVSARVAAGSGERLVESAVKQLVELFHAP